MILVFAVGLHVILFAIIAHRGVFSAPAARAPVASFLPVKIKVLPLRPNTIAPGDGFLPFAGGLTPTLPSFVVEPVPHFTDSLPPSPAPDMDETLRRVQPPLQPPGIPWSGLGDGLGVQMSQLLFQLPLAADGNSCPATSDDDLMLHLVDDRTHTCTLLIRGVVEQSTYVGGKTEGYVCAGGTPQTGTFNIYELDVDDPPQTYYLNAGQSGITHLFAIHYKLTIQIKNNSRLRLHADSIDRLEVPNSDSLSVEDEDPRYALAVQQPYHGQFMQIDALSLDQETGGPLLDAALQGTSQSAGSFSAANVISAPAAKANESPSVHPVNVDLEQNNEDNLWIYVGLNGGTAHRYLFDTGSWGFYATYCPQWWPGRTASLFKTDGTALELYGDMTYGYRFVPVYSSVKLYNYYNGLLAYTFPEDDYGVGKILTKYDVYKPAQGDIEENPDVNQAKLDAANGIPDSLDDHGIFGAGTCVQWEGSDTLGYANLSNLLAETPGGGYILTDNGPLGRATLTVGLNAALRRQFTQFLALHPDYSSGGFPNTHWPSYDPPVVQITLSRAGYPSIVFRGDFWLDTGSGPSTVRIPDDAGPQVSAYMSDDGSLRPGTKIHVTDPSRKDGLDYTRDVYVDDADKRPFHAKIYKKTDEVGVWFGIDFFRHDAVMYDLKNGVMGFDPRRPELDPTVLNSP